ncbi:MAG: LysR family transcriptional regulator [Burkholderiales bacterium]|nr:LysR family transcriptional regulator [Burkholderiales bacterium]
MPADLRFPSIEALRAFEVASRLGTFERAADELAVTASAVSKRVASIEELIGTPLFVRSGKALQLTAAGREYLQQVGAALGLLAAMPQHRRARQRVHKLRVCAPPTFARQVLVPGLESFTAAHPEVELEIVLSIPYLDRQAADADIEVRHGDASAGRALLHDRVLPLAAPALLERLPPLRVPSDLAHAPLLRTPIEPWTPWFRAAGLAWPEPASGPKFVDLGLTLEAAVAGQGVALGRPSLARHWLQGGSLKPLFSISAEPAGQYFIAPFAAADPAAAAFAAWLTEACARIDLEAQEALSGAA